MLNYYHKDHEKFVFVLRKDVMCYEYLDSGERFNKKFLPSEEKFSTEVNNEEILDKDSRHTQKV